MRDLLFRGMSVERRRWVYGGYTSVYGAKPVIITDCTMEDDCSLTFEYEHVRADSIGIWTGLRDKNMRDIYEGDILIVGGNDGNPAVVRYETSSFVCAIPKFPNYLHRLEKYPPKYEIIGNVFENPELLDSPKTEKEKPNDMKEMTAKEYALFRIEMTRRELMKLLAKVELGTDIGCQLGEILENAVNAVEALAEDANEIEEGNA